MHIRIYPFCLVIHLLIDFAFCADSGQPETSTEGFTSQVYDEEPTRPIIPHPHNADQPPASSHSAPPPDLPITSKPTIHKNPHEHRAPPNFIPTRYNTSNKAPNAGQISIILEHKTTHHSAWTTTVQRSAASESPAACA